MQRESTATHTRVPEELIQQVETRFDAYLHGLLRYDRFRMAGETPADWVEILGPDVLSATHPHVTAELTAQFIQVQNEQNPNDSVDPSDGILLMALALVHDWGEIKIEEVGIGDRSFDQKTAADEEVEITVFEQICRDLPVGPDLELIREAYKTLQTKEGLGEIFNAVERIGYLATALRAYRGHDGRFIENRDGLVGNVLSNQIKKLIEYAQKYPFVQQVLTENAFVIDEAFRETVFIGEVPLDNEGKDSFDRNKLMAAYEAWKQFTAQQGSNAS